MKLSDDQVADMLRYWLTTTWPPGNWKGSKEELKGLFLERFPGMNENDGKRKKRK
jgi:hypothetical protein